MHLIELAVYRSRPSYVQKVFRSLNLISSGTSNLTLRFPCTGRITSVVIKYCHILVRLPNFYVVSQYCISGGVARQHMIQIPMASFVFDNCREISKVLLCIPFCVLSSSSFRSNLWM